MVKKIAHLIPSRLDEFSKRYAVKEFKNRDGEGVVAMIIDKESPEVAPFGIACGNDKLMKSQNIDFSEVRIRFLMRERESLASGG